jgi:hypothetical protein
MWFLKSITTYRNDIDSTLNWRQDPFFLFPSFITPRFRHLASCIIIKNLAAPRVLYDKDKDKDK